MNLELAVLDGAANRYDERLAPAVEFDRSVAAVRAQMDEEAFARAWSEGRAMSMTQAIDYALELAEVTS